MLFAAPNVEQLPLRSKHAKNGKKDLAVAGRGEGLIDPPPSVHALAYPFLEQWWLYVECMCSIGCYQIAD